MKRIKRAKAVNWVNKVNYIIGIDEVGRGALAGPVTVAAVFLPRKFSFAELSPNLTRLSLVRLKDSKKLTSGQREKWFKYVKNHPRIFYKLASVSPKIIDRINISRAANRAAVRAFQKLRSSQDLRIGGARVLLDGGLYLTDDLRLSADGLSAKTIVRGDEKYNAIKLASIVAKVNRDRFMARLHEKHPLYGFDVHKGYGTRKHVSAIRRFGISPVHRLTFVKKYRKIK